MKRHSVIVAFCVSTLLSLAAGRLESKERTDGVRHFDVVLTGGRVIDPETGLDAIRNVGIRGDTIAEVSTKRLEKATRDAKNLGRLQQGAQADIVAFDPQTIQDRAAFRAPTEASSGVRYLVVAETVVVDGGRIVEGAVPGRALVRSPKGRP